MVEFVLIAITFLFSILAVLQLALVLNAYALVRYAAYNAARAGVVHGGDPQMMQEAARLSLISIFPTHGRADHVLGVTENYLAAKGTDSDASMSPLGTPITEVKVINQDSLSCGTVITFDDPKQGGQGLLTVEVVHQYHLVIPLVNRIYYWVYKKFHSGEGYQGQTLDNLAADTDKRRRTGDFKGIEYRMPIVAHYTMRLQSDYAAPACPTTTTTTTTSSSTTTTNNCGVVNNPTMGGMKLDNCVHWGVECGIPAASLYCQTLGCSHATAFQMGPAQSQTWIIGDNTNCSNVKAGVNYNFCVPFSQVICAK